MHQEGGFSCKSANKHLARRVRIAYIIYAPLPQCMWGAVQKKGLSGVGESMNTSGIKGSAIRKGA